MKVRISPKYFNLNVCHNFEIVACFLLLLLVCYLLSDQLSNLTLQNLWLKLRKSSGLKQLYVLIFQIIDFTPGRKSVFRVRSSETLIIHTMRHIWSVIATLKGCMFLHQEKVHVMHSGEGFAHQKNRISSYCEINEIKTSKLTTATTHSFNTTVVTQYESLYRKAV